MEAIIAALIGFSAVLLVTVLSWIRSDIKSDVGGLKSDVGEVESDVGGLKSDVGEVKSGRRAQVGCCGQVGYG